MQVPLERILHIIKIHNHMSSVHKHMSSVHHHESCVGAVCSETVVPFPAGARNGIEICEENGIETCQEKASQPEDFLHTRQDKSQTHYSEGVCSQAGPSRVRQSTYGISCAKEEIGEDRCSIHTARSEGRKGQARSSELEEFCNSGSDPQMGR
jgi:hypothetical protein